MVSYISLDMVVVGSREQSRAERSNDEGIGQGGRSLCVGEEKRSLFHKKKGASSYLH